MQGASDGSATLGPAAALTLSDMRFNLRLDVNAQVPFRLSAPLRLTACAEERSQVGRGWWWAHDCVDAYTR